MTRIAAAAVLLAATAAEATPSVHAGTNAAQRGRERTVTATVGGDVAGTTHLLYIPLEASVSGVATVGFFLDADHLVEARLRFGQHLDADPTVRWYAGGGARLRKFVGDAMYVAAGPEVRTFAVRDSMTALTDGPVDGHVVTLGADLGIGHQWQWDRYTFGVEWFGVTRPILPLAKLVDGELPEWSHLQFHWGETHYVSPYFGATW
jgi:hypothetical protein